MNHWVKFALEPLVEHPFVGTGVAFHNLLQLYWSVFFTKLKNQLDPPPKLVIYLVKLSLGHILDGNLFRLVLFDHRCLSIAFVDALEWSFGFQVGRC